MSSPWPPSTIARTSFTLTPASRARKSWKRALSSTPAMPTTMLLRRAGDALVLVDHRVERVRDDDHERVRAVLLRVVGDVADDGQVDGDEVVARLAGLARDAGGDDEHVGAGEVGPVGRAADVRVVAEDGAVLLEVERLALGEVLLRGDVEEDDVAELLVRAEARELAADVSGSDETDLLAVGHGGVPVGLGQREGKPRGKVLHLGMRRSFGGLTAFSASAAPLAVPAAHRTPTAASPRTPARRRQQRRAKRGRGE